VADRADYLHFTIFSYNEKLAFGILTVAGWHLAFLVE